MSRRCLAKVMAAPESSIFAVGIKATGECFLSLILKKMRSEVVLHENLLG